MNVPNLRFPEFKEEWETYKIKEIFDFLPNYNFTRNQMNEEKGNIKNIHYGDIHTKYRQLVNVKRENIPFIDNSVDTSNIKDDAYCMDGDIVVAVKSENKEDTGKTVELTWCNCPCVAGQSTFLLRAKPEYWDWFFLGFKGYLFSTPRIRKEMERITNGAQIFGIRKKDLGNIEINFPNSVDEQAKITRFLYLFDRLC